MESETDELPVRVWRPLLIPVVLVQLAVFLVVARYRLIDGDEGFYLMASRLVFEHRVPYRDFFFTQMPLLPYIYGLWMQVAGLTWMSARALSVLVATILGTAMYVHVCKETGKWAAGLVTIALFVSSTHVFAWLPLVKTFALTSLFLFLAYLSISRYSSTHPKRAFAVGGLMLGLSADVRLYVAGLLPMLILWILFAPQVRARRIALLWFLGGFALSVLPNLYLLALAPDAYVFGNLGFHAIRSSEGLVGGLRGKVDTLFLLLLSRGSGNGFQIGLLYMLCALSIPFSHSAATRLACYIAAVLTLISFLPTPSYTQYFCLAVPFLIVAVVCSVGDLMQRYRKGSRTRLIAVVSAGLVSAFIAISIKDFDRFLLTGKGVIGIAPDRAVDYKIDSVVAVSRKLDELATAGEQVMSLWPGYVAQSKTEPLPGFENNTGRELTRALSPERMSKYHMVSQQGIEAQLAAHVPRLVVVGNQESMYPEYNTVVYLRMLQQCGYQPKYVLSGASLWIAPRP